MVRLYSSRKESFPKLYLDDIDINHDKTFEFALLEEYRQSG